MKKTLLVILFSLIVQGCSSVKIEGEKFDIEMVATSEEGKTRHVRYNIYTGETWLSSNTKWVKIKEAEEIPESKYKVTIVSTGKSWRTLRLDMISGKTWKNSGGSWIEFTGESE